MIICKNGDIHTQGTVTTGETNPSKSASISNFLDILKLNAYSNSKKGKQYFGFSGSEVQKYFPSLVSDFDNSKAIAYTEFVPLLVETVKKQQKTIDQLQAENANMKKEIDDIEIRLQKLENKKTLNDSLQKTKF